MANTFYGTVLRHRIFQNLPVGKKALKQGIKAIRICVAGCDIQRTGQDRSFVSLSFTQHMIARFPEKLPGLTGFQNLKSWSKTGFDREELQNSFAKSMYRLNLEATGRLQCRCEKPPGPRQYLGADIIMPHLDEPRGERCIGEANPLAEPFVEAIGHFLGCRLCIGEAKDCHGINACKHEAGHPVHEHMGLAGARIGTNPGGGRGIGSCLLLRRGAHGFGH